MEKDTRKLNVNILDAEIASFLSVIDPLNHVVKHNFNLQVIDDQQISLLGIPIQVKLVIHSEATPAEVEMGFENLKKKLPCKWCL
ncbi:MAG: hypothetical protein WB975_09185 [Nitrososphaeraceae archaeon]